MNYSQDAVDLIKHFEGCSLTAYPDPGTNGAPFTIGYGHTGDVGSQDTITQDIADLMLLRDIKRFEAGLNTYIRADIKQCQFDALISLVFNIGLGNFSTSTLLKMINAGSADAAADQFIRWNKAAGREMPGLTKRRQAETLLYQGKSWQIG